MNQLNDARRAREVPSEEEEDDDDGDDDDGGGGGPFIDVDVDIG